MTAQRIKSYTTRHVTPSDVTITIMHRLRHGNTTSSLVVERGGRGCLIRDTLHGSKSSSERCWVGWFQKQIPNAFLELEISDDKNRNENAFYVFIQAYINKTENIRSFKSIKIGYKTKRNGTETIYGTFCSPVNQSDIYVPMVNLPKIKYLRFYMEYSSPWIVLRKITILKQGKNLFFDLIFL